MKDFVHFFGKKRVDQAKEGGELLFRSLNFTCEMRVVAHEAVGVNRHLIAIFIFQEKVVVELFSLISFEKPGVVVALPSDVEDRTIPDDLITGERGHMDTGGSKRCAKRS